MDIIKDSRSTNKVLDRTIRSEALTSNIVQNTLTVPSKTTVEEFNKVNAERLGQLCKETKVKPPRKRGNFDHYRGCKKFQLNNNWNRC
jgi:hypothetical protein